MNLPHSCTGDNPYHLYRLFLEDPVVRGAPGVLHEPKDKIKPEIESRFILFRNFLRNKTYFIFNLLELVKDSQPRSLTTGGRL